MDDIHIEIGGSSVYMIEGAGTEVGTCSKAPVKYNPDAFIVIKNRSRNEFVPWCSKPPSEPEVSEEEEV